tara:strand:- start:10993 stop:12321 length:1329 start_codon:yes stop_codon:yes gene_type:complete
MLPLFLIILLSIFVFFSVVVMLRRGHDLHALAFFTLFTYTVFSQIGYAYFPELSILIGAYYGPTLFYKYWFFMFFSFVFTFLLYLLIFPESKKEFTYMVKPTHRNFGQYFFFLIVILLYSILSLYFEVYRDTFRYGGGRTMGGPWFGVGFWIFTLCTLILFTLFRNKSNNYKKRIFSLALFFICLTLFLQVTIASGIRSAIFYFFLSIAFYELSPLLKTVKFQKRKVFIFVLSAFLVLGMLTVLRSLRIQGDEVNFSSFVNYEGDREEEVLYQTWATALLFQDYYLPSHTLFVSMQYNVIEPLEVLKSNLANSLVRLDYPHLTSLVVANETGENEQRGTGWGYHYFVEGYNAVGMFGVIYNALLWNLGMLLWIKLTQSNNRMHNRVMISISVLVIVIVMRSQTSAFIQFYWMVLLSGMALLLLANNSTITFLRKNIRANKDG